MRRCALWVTPWVAQDQEYILDTAAPVGDATWLRRVAGPDPFPPDTVLLVVHPAREQVLLAAAMDPVPYVDGTLLRTVWGRQAARVVIDRHCHADPGLARKLRW